MLNLILLFFLCIPVGGICGLYILFTQQKKNLSPRLKIYRAIANVLLPACIAFITLGALLIYYADEIYHILF